MTNSTDSQRMHIHPVHQSIADLLGGTITFEVPRYQRNYAWGPDQVSAFIKDQISASLHVPQESEGITFSVVL